MPDMVELARMSFRQKLGTYLILVLLVAFTVAGYLVVASYWKDAGRVSTTAAESLNFPYVKATVVFAYWTNPPFTRNEEPPPRKYAPVFNDGHLNEIRRIPRVLDLSVALSQDTFSRFGSNEMLSLEAGAPLWQALKLVSGRLPQDTREVLVPKEFADAGTQIGQVLAIRIPRTIMPRTYRVDSKLVQPIEPEPLKNLTVTGVYEPFSSVISGYVGYVPVNRVSDYSEEDPEKVDMAWPVPNTILLHLTDPLRAEAVLAEWRSMYHDLPGADPPLIPPIKLEWTSQVPELMARRATGEVATPMYTNTMNAFGLGAIGIFASMFVSLLDRRRDLGIMKTLGIDNSHTAGTVSMEVAFAGSLGTLLGIVSAILITGYCLKGISGNSIPVPWGVVMTGAAVSSAILIVATHIPRAMARQGTVMELLYGRPIPIYRKRY
jgi:hypothetical protein